MTPVPNKPHNKPNTIFKPLWKESIFAIKESIRFKDFSNFRHHMEEVLPQNSEYTRKRFMRTIIKRFFPTQSLYTIPSQVWRYYKNDEILHDVMRYQFLMSEPVVAEFVTRIILPSELGTSYHQSTIRDFVIATYGDFNKDSAGNIGTAIQYLGFVYRYKDNLLVREIQPAKTALMILTHHLFAQTPRTVTLREILEHPFWSYLGIGSKEAVRKTFREAEARRIIAKYAVVDELEQITTKMTLSELLEQRTKL